MKARRLLVDDSGTATVAVAGMIAVLLGLTGAMALAGRQVIAEHQAQVAADMAVIAGAHAHYRGLDACSWARELAGANGGELVNCGVEGADVQATVAVAGAEAASKAGPMGGKEEKAD